MRLSHRNVSARSAPALAAAAVVTSLALAPGGVSAAIVNVGFSGSAGANGGSPNTTTQIGPGEAHAGQGALWADAYFDGSRTSTQLWGKVSSNGTSYIANATAAASASVSFAFEVDVESTYTLTGQSSWYRRAPNAPPDPSYGTSDAFTFTMVEVQLDGTYGYHIESAGAWHDNQSHGATSTGTLSPGTTYLFAVQAANIADAGAVTYASSSAASEGTLTVEPVNPSLQFTAVPEPSATLAGVGLIGALGLRRRHR